MNLNPSDLGGAAAGLNGKTKINMNAMQSQLNRNMKMALTKERMQKKLDEKRSAAAAAAQSQQELKHSVYQPPNAEKNEKTPRVPMAAPEAAPAATGYEPSNSNSKPSHKKNKHKK
jgi:hypothetical protein